MISLFIGRFQPFHKGHLHDIKEALKFSDNVIIAVGSSQESGTNENPFSYDERKEMIEKVIKKERIPNTEVYPVPDINDDAMWADHVISITGDADIIYTGNKWVKKLFRQKGFEVRDVSFLPEVNATEIRKRMHHGKDWESLVPAEVADIIHKVGGVNRVKRINGKL
ncbi:nicotinamide-nucleotide adenylyltransferase [Candidatus Woesearchaeota archaeon]|nr:nicotinamide-nucleotide adenylyltransferase [Candidatus Woesearchaeota archaeon]